MRERLKAGILGATGAVGQKFVALLAGHPWFEISSLMASDRSAGRPYREAANWIGQTPIPEHVAGMLVEECRPDVPCDLVFSGLDSSVAGDIESEFAAHGYAVISNARNHRMDPTVPLLVPEINAGHLGLLDTERADGRGYIVTNPNCSTVGLVCALKPLQDAFGLEAVIVTTMQALSGAGYPGVPALDIVGNVLPYIPGEEEKIVSEPRKLLGRLVAGELVPLDVPISAQCNRVPVVDGHMLSISVRLRVKPSIEALRNAFSTFTSSIDDLDLPSGRSPLLEFFDDPTYPQPLRQANLGGGMTVSIGRLKPCGVLDFRFVALVHNTIRGAAGGALLNAELLVAKGYLPV